MASYQISDRSKKIAAGLGYSLKLSDRPFKKIAVYNRQGNKIADIGDSRYNDFHTYKKKFGLEYAKARRLAYYKRHKKNIQAGAGRLAWLLLWN